MSNELALIISIVGLIASIIAIVSFFIGRKDKNLQVGAEHGEMANDIKYIKQTQTDILVGNKEISNKLDKTHDQVIRQEEQIKSLDKRITKLENRKRGE